MENNFFKSFASDNYGSASLEVIEFLAKINKGHCRSYGDDPHTKQVEDLFRHHFGDDVETYLVSSGTAANVLSLKHVIESYEAVITPRTSHLYIHEAAALENYVGCKIHTITTPDGKLTPRQIIEDGALSGQGNVHFAQIKAISIAQPTELGTYYTVEEIQSLSQFAHDHDLYLHMDGARLANAAVALNLPFKSFTFDAGVDLLSFGGTKNGLMFGEAIVFSKAVALKKEFPYIRKQGMQLTSKMRYLDGQFLAYFENDLWKRNAQNANNMAKKLGKELKKINGVTLDRPVETNIVYAKLSDELLERFSHEDPYSPTFYVWNKATNEIRLVVAFDIEESDIEHFIRKLS